MANIYVSEAERLVEDANGNILPVFPIATIRSQKIAFTTAASIALDPRTKFVRLYADAAFHLESGKTATANSPRFSTDTEYFRAVNPRKTLSVYDGSS